MLQRHSCTREMLGEMYGTSREAMELSAIRANNEPSAIDMLTEENTKILQVAQRI